jgi:hypothetical protein
MKVTVRYWTEFGGSESTMKVEEIASFSERFKIMSVTPVEEDYHIVINDVAKFRVELMTMIEKVKFNVDGYANSSSSQIAESFEHKINSFINK